MIHNGADWRMKIRHAVLALFAACLAGFGSPTAHAQSIMRSPSINVQSRIPNFTPSVAPRIDPNVAGRAVTGSGNNSSLRIHQPCDAAYREKNGECSDQPIGASGKNIGGNSSDVRRNALQASLNSRVTNEIVAEIDGAADALARRHGLTLLEAQEFPLVGATIGLFRVNGRKTVEAASRELRTDSSVRSFQPNFRYLLQDQGTELTEGDPAQYAQRETSAAPGAYAGPWRQRHRRGDQFRDRPQASRIRGLDDRSLRRARQQGRSARPWHRRGRRDRIACAADGQRASGADFGDPRVRCGAKGRGKHVVRDPEGPGLRGCAMAPRSSI